MGTACILSSGVANTTLLNIWHQHIFAEDAFPEGPSGGWGQFPWDTVATSAGNNSDLQVNAAVNQVGEGTDLSYMQYAGPDSTNDQGNGLSDTSGPSGMTGHSDAPDTGFAQSLRAQPIWFIVYMGSDYEWET